MLRTNLWAETGLANGARGTVKEIIYSSKQIPGQHLPTAVLVDFPKYKGNAFSPKCGPQTIPICPKRVIVDISDKEQASRRNVPFDLCWGMTIHKSQGLTIEEGISLHQAEQLADGPGSNVPRAEVIHDLRWSGIQMAQIEGRCHRDGRYAQVFWTYADDTIEVRIAKIVCRRLQSMKAMVGDDPETLAEIERVLTT